MKLRATIADWAMFPWETQAEQYPSTGPSGISYFRGELEGSPHVDCLLYRNEAGELLGILNYYSVDMAQLEKAGNVNIWIHPEHQRQGIGTLLLDEADKRYGPLNFRQQRYTEAGVAFTERYLRRRK
jgi:ribosomal protein S18 acetylase RimI-like enzyme